MKAQQIQNSAKTKTAHSIQKHTGRRRLFAGLAAAAAVMIGGTITAGALNSWNYSGLINRYFRVQNSNSESYEDFDFTGMGLDFNDVLDADGYTMIFRSVVADVNAIHVLCNFQMDPEYEAQFPQSDEQLFGSCLPRVRIKDTAGEFADNGIVWANKMPQNEDGSFDCMVTIELKDYCTTLSDLMLEINPDGYAMVGTKEAFRTGGDLVHTPYAPDLSVDTYTYSLDGITVLPNGHAESGVTLQYETGAAEFDSVTVSPLGILFRASDVPVIPAATTEPGVSIRSGCYGVGKTYVADWEEPEADVTEYEPEYEVSDPVPEAYREMSLKSITLIYRDGTEQDAEIYMADGSGRTKCSASDIYDLMDIEYSAVFAQPYRVDGLTAVRVNGFVIPLD